MNKTEVFSISSPSNGLSNDKTLGLDFDDSIIDLSRQNSDLSSISISYKSKRKNHFDQDISTELDANPISGLPSIDAFDNSTDSPRILRRTSTDDINILEFSFQPDSDKKGEPGIHHSLSTDIMDITFRENSSFDKDIFSNSIFRNDSMDDGNFGHITVTDSLDDDNISETNYMKSDEESIENKRVIKKPKIDKITNNKTSNDAGSKSPISTKSNSKTNASSITNKNTHSESKDTDTLLDDNIALALQTNTSESDYNMYSDHAEKLAINFRGKYRCGRCGKLKNNHDCEYEEALTCDRETQTLTKKILINEKGNNLEKTDRILVINTSRSSIHDNGIHTTMQMHQNGLGAASGTTSLKTSIADSLPNIIMPATSATYTPRVGYLAPGCYFARDPSGQYYHVDASGVTTKLVTFGNYFFGLDGFKYFNNSINGTGNAMPDKTN